MMKSETMPGWLWRLVLIALLSAILLILLLLVLALGGVSNSGHIGMLVVRDDLDRDAGWALRSEGLPVGAMGRIDNGFYQVTLPRSKMHTLLVAPYQLHTPCTIMIAARQIEGPTDAGYGLWWGDASGEDHHAAAVNGDGYVTVFQSTGGDMRAIMEWQVFPRVQLQGEANTLLVDLDGAQVLVRVNDEVAATFEWAPARSLEAGFYVETLSTGGTTVNFDWLAIWQG